MTKMKKWKVGIAIPAPNIPVPELTVEARTERAAKWAAQAQLIRAKYPNWCHAYIVGEHNES